MIRPDPQGPAESRLVYLARVLVAFMDDVEFNLDSLIHYDGADCDGVCLAEDIQNAVYAIPDLNELKKAVAFYDAAEDDAPDHQIEYLIKAARRITR